MARRTWKVWPPVVFAVIILSFLTATGLGQWRMRELDSALMEIATTTGPSVEHLASTRGQIRNLQSTLRARVSEMNGPSSDTSTVEEARRMLDATAKDYLALPVAPDERGVWRGVLAGKEAIDHATMRFESDVVHGDREAAMSRLQGDVATAAADLDTATTNAIEFNGARARDLAIHIRSLRTSALYAAIGLDIVCTAIAICGAVVLRRVFTKHEALRERHDALEQERTMELEQFAGRVAHDILSPLSTVGLALELAKQSLQDTGRAKALDRGIAALARVKRMVTGLLDFARAGANPDPEAQADVAEVMSDLAAELEPTAKAAGAELTMAASTRREVACNAGVLTSLIANLARNAIKYIGDGSVRRVSVRAVDRGDAVRVEVVDTGPGLPPDIEHRAFDAYARSRKTTKPGVGLGLATVKRLAEAHGGRVGVISVPGQGCTFWFELPAVPAPTDAALVTKSEALGN